jgi:1-phosphofructokinase family hexose kinase
MKTNIKIAVLTLNPGIDRIIYLDTPARLGTLNRASRTVVSQGSKGANVSIVLKNLGADPVYFAFSGGSLGGLSESFTNKYGVRANFMPSAAGVRVNTKIIDSEGVCTEFNERGGPVSQAELDSLLHRMFSDKYNMLVVCGSIPQGVDNSVYNCIIKRFNENGALTVLDCDGEAMKRGLAARPALIKPNRRELAGILGVPENEVISEAAVLEGCRTVRQDYGCDVICTLDEKGSVFCGAGGEYRIEAARVPLRGFTGAGDTYLAAYLYKKYVDGEDSVSALRYASAAAGAKVALPGTELPCAGQIEEVFKTGISVDSFSG